VGASFSDLPPTAAWRHYGAREGVECVFLGTRGRGFRSQTFDFEAALAYDTSGLVVDYPGIGSRIV
jgi:hypothetical protein